MTQPQEQTMWTDDEMRALHLVLADFERKLAAARSTGARIANTTTFCVYITFSTGD